MLLPDGDRYEDLRDGFVWDIPQRFNIGDVVSDQWALKAPDRVCLEHFSADGHHLALTYGQLTAKSNAFANALVARGVKAGDRVAILLPQSFETVIAHVAAYKMGAIALPLALLFGPDALEYRLRDSGACVLVTNRFGLSKLEGLGDKLTALQHIVLVDGEAEGAENFQTILEGHPSAFDVVATGPNDPALMIYTSGTTGPPKGALHGHRVLAGHIPGMQFVHPGLGQAGDKLWTPSDWAWAGGLLNCLLPGLMLGVPVVASPAQKFDPDLAYRILSEMKVRNAFIPPTALKLLRPVENPRGKYDLQLRTIGSAGEALGRETYLWAKSELGITINEFYGQTECNFILAASAEYGITKPGSMGKPVPGHAVAIIDEDGDIRPPGVTGQVAIRRPDPVMFLEYWNNPNATEAKFVGEWMRTGDQGVMDEEGYFHFFGRDDDVITSSGYRIGPGEIEDCLIGHPAVQLAAAIGKPDPLRTEIVKAFVVLKPGHSADAAMESSIRDWVKTRLSMHEYPREIEFINSLPMTTTGKVIRRLLREPPAAAAQ
ncbi:AMP-binding protein [Rhizobium sp. L1K21]|uniref:AMP-binding protein n=1 Tax=Rhizobium sp. L1K21 TaxID=2954933 RepID=UPI0020927A9D|nr:AMP-binding protein [Rhizobium sp. L1K21]MCO6188191.1 AMP-binding protein [Rhizobium sp. L1K21]